LAQPFASHCGAAGHSAIARLGPHDQFEHDSIYVNGRRKERTPTNEASTLTVSDMIDGLRTYTT